MLVIDYEKPSRFKHPTKKEMLQDLIYQVCFILSSTKSTGWLKDSGVLTQFLGLKGYRDKRISNLQEICSSDTFKDKSPGEQFELLKLAIDGAEPSLFEQLFVKENKNISNFINAIKSEDTQALNKIVNDIKNVQQKANNTVAALENMFEFLSKPVTRDRCLFKKEQAFAAANWWLDRLKNDVPVILTRLNKRPITPVELTAEQEQIFTTTLADLIWDTCQIPQLNVKGQSSLYVGYKSEFVQEALRQANIKVDGDEKLGGGLTAFICQDGTVTFEHGSRLGNIYDPDKIHPENAIPRHILKKAKKYNPQLPEDNVIEYRDILSTVLDGKPRDFASTNLYSLPREILSEVLMYSKPDSLESDRAIKQIAWNQERLVNLHRFFQEKSNMLKSQPPELASESVKRPRICQ